MLEKPNADLYIDDKALRYTGDWAQTMQEALTMPFASNVMPKRRVREKPKDWQCACSQTKPGYQLQCFTCGTRRP